MDKKAQIVESGKGICEDRGRRGRLGKSIPRVSASIMSSRAVMTQSTSRTVCVGELGDEGRQ